MSSGSTSTVDAQVILLETRFYMLNSISKPILWCFNLFFFWCSCLQNCYFPISCRTENHVASYDWFYCSTSVRSPTTRFRRLVLFLNFTMQCLQFKLRPTWSCSNDFSSATRIESVECRYAASFYTSLSIDEIRWFCGFLFSLVSLRPNIYTNSNRPVTLSVNSMRNEGIWM